MPQVKTAQYEAALAKSRAEESMQQLKAKNERSSQESAWREFMARRAQEEEAERQADLEAKRRFAQERAYKREEAERDEEAGRR